MILLPIGLLSIFLKSDNLIVNAMFKNYLFTIGFLIQFYA